MKIMTKEEYDEYYNTYGDNNEKLKRLDKLRSTVELNPLERKNYNTAINKLKSILDDSASNKEKILNTLRHANWKTEIISYNIIGNWEDLVISFKPKKELKDISWWVD